MMFVLEATALSKVYRKPVSPRDYLISMEVLPHRLRQIVLVKRLKIHLLFFVVVPASDLFYLAVIS